MLPSHLIDPTKKKNERLNHTRLGQAPPPPMPSLCLTGAMSQIGRCEVTPGKTLVYCVFRPRQLHDTRRPPLVICHGGPSIPSNYLLPIVNGVTDRAVILYDQYGCGKSSRPSRTNTPPPFSIPLMVEHLECLITKQWGLKRYHLFGHSFGGILAYEFLLKQQQRRQQSQQSDYSEDDRAETHSHSNCCQSLILGSTPTSARLIQDESKRLYNEVNGLSDTAAVDDSSSAAEVEDPLMRQEHSETFCQTHECRLAQPPLVLMDAMAQAGPTSWRGIPAISDYEAKDKLSHPSTTLLIRGQYDFCTPVCMKGWDHHLDTIEERTVPNCSHYGMLEDEQQYGSILSNFLKQHDPS